jgi:hypothetical protein
MPILTVRKEIRLSMSTECPLCGNSAGKQLLKAPDRFHGRKHPYELERCSSCHLVRLVDPPSPQEMPVHYSQSYHTSIEEAGETKLARRWKRHRNTVLNLKSGGALLDIGCGSGAFLRTVKGSAWRLHGVEISRHEAENARILWTHHFSPTALML